jgi:hypothetical protein
MANNGDDQHSFKDMLSVMRFFVCRMRMYRCMGFDGVHVLGAERGLQANSESVVGMWHVHVACIGGSGCMPCCVYAGL